MADTFRIFPTPVRLAKIGTDYELDWLKSIDYYRTELDNGYISIDSNILDHENLKPLKSKIVSEFTEFFTKELSYSDKVKYEIITSWVVKNIPKDWAQKHYHINSFWSGVYYFEVPLDSGGLILHKDDKPTIGVPYYERNDITHDQFQINPTAGTVVYFPSRVDHTVQVNRSNSDRYCIAFNIFPRGVLGVNDIERLIL